MQLLWKTVGEFLKKLKLEQSYNPEISKKTKTLISKDTLAVLFTVAKIWKQPKYP